MSLPFPLIKKNDPAFAPRGAHIGSVFQLSQDSIEGDYLLRLAFDQGRRQVIVGSDDSGLYAHFIEEATETNNQVYGTWDELMSRTLQWLGRFGEPRSDD